MSSKQFDDTFWRDIHDYINKKKNDIETERFQRRGENKVRKCSNCQSFMTIKVVEQVMVDYCESCGGIFLDKGELELLYKTRSESGFIPTIKRLFGIG